METIKVHKWVITPEGEIKWVECEIPAYDLMYQDPIK
jgi:hypothetical protein